jgi:single-strand DNA-binding protein
MSNFVVLNGTLSGEIQSHVQADGVEVLQWRLRVPRAEGGADSVPCTSSSSRVMKTIVKLKEDQIVELEGSVRSRYWRSGGSTQSRVEIDVTKVSKLK